jgi:NADH-quinone oxidoreductase subunit M
VFGKVTKPENANLLDLSARERLVLIPLVLFVFWIGVYPAPFLSRIEPAVKQVLTQVGRAQVVQTGEELKPGLEIKDNARASVNSDIYTEDEIR